MICFVVSGEKPWSEDFEDYVNDRGYDLLTIKEYETLMVDSGFVNVKAEDMTSLFDDYLHKELARFETIKDDFIKVRTLNSHPTNLDSQSTINLSTNCFLSQIFLFSTKKEFYQEDYYCIVAGWREKIKRTKQGHQKWGVVYAEKPSAP